MTTDIKPKEAEQKPTTEESLKSILQIYQDTRYINQMKTTFGNVSDSLLGGLGLGQATRKAVLTGNPSDKKLVLGAMLTQVTLKSGAMAGFIEALENEDTDQ